MLGGERPSRERQCPFLLPAMQTETEKDQIPKFLFKPKVPQPRWRHRDCHLGSPGAEHSSFEGRGADRCDDEPAVAGAGVRPSGCCIPGPEARLCRPGLRQCLWPLAHPVSPEQPWLHGDCHSSGTYQGSCRQARGTLVLWGVEPLAHLGTVVAGHRGGDHASFLADDSSSESCSGNGSSTLNPSTSSSTQGDSTFPEMNGNGTAAPMDFTTSADDQPINLCDKLTPAHVTPSYQSDGCSADGLRSRVKYAVKTTAEVQPGLPAQHRGG